MDINHNLAAIQWTLKRCRCQG